MTTNANLVNVVLRTADGKTSRINGVNAKGYTIDGTTRTIDPATLVRRGKVLVELPREVLKDTAPERIVKMDGYIHIHSRDVMRQIKKGEVVDTPPVFTEWKRSTAPAKVIKPRSVKTGKIKSDKTVKVNGDKAKPTKVKTAKANGNVKPKTDEQKKIKPVPKRVAMPKSTPVDRQFETAEQLFGAMQAAITNPRTWKEFNQILSDSLNVTVKDLPDTASAIVEKYGVPKVRKAINALKAHYNSLAAEQSMPRHMKKFVESGKIVLNKTQIKAVIAALSPTIPEEIIPLVVDRFFGNGEFELVHKNRKAQKVSGGE